MLLLKRDRNNYLKASNPSRVSLIVVANHHMGSHKNKQMRTSNSHKITKIGSNHKKMNSMSFLNQSRWLWRTIGNRSSGVSKWNLNSCIRMLSWLTSSLIQSIMKPRNLRSLLSSRLYNICKKIFAAIKSKKGLSWTISRSFWLLFRPLEIKQY
jgi:hypothetical protein